MTACGGGGDDELADANTIDAFMAPDGETVCHGLTNTGPFIQAVQVADDRPEPQGGTIVDGTYHRSARILHTGAGGATGPAGPLIAETHVFAGGVDRFVVAEGTEERGGLMDYLVNGTGIAFTFTCPAGQQAPSFDSYTATDQSLTLLGTAGPNGVELVLDLVQAAASP